MFLNKKKFSKCEELKFQKESKGKTSLIRELTLIYPNYNRSTL